MQRNAQKIGLTLGILLGLAVGWWPIEGLSGPAHVLLAVMALVVVFWLTEALPLWVTAFLGCGLCWGLGVAKPEEIFNAFLDPIIFLFVGSFLLARAMHVHGLDRRIAFHLLSHAWVGTSARRALLVFGLAAFFLGMWVSITACVAMLFPIALIAARSEETSHNHRQVTAFLLMLPYAASAGALATPVGTPPNLIGMTFIRDILGTSISFIQWMKIGLPVAIILFVVRYAILLILFKPTPHLPPKQIEKIRMGLQQLGPWTRGQQFTLVVFGLAIAMWVMPFLSTRVTVGHAALIAAGLLFVLPSGPAHHKKVLVPQDLLKIDWATICLFAGGLALGRLILDTGLGDWLGSAWFARTEATSAFWLIGLAVVAAVIFSEIASNTAAANVVVPLILMAAGQDRNSALSMAIAATLGTSLGFMLPVSTPANAIVYGSGAIRLKDMIRSGLLVDVAGIPIVWFASYWLVPLVMGRS